MLLIIFSGVCQLLLTGYELERKDHPGQFVDLNSKLKSQGTMDFALKHIRKC